MPVVNLEHRFSLRTLKLISHMVSPEYCRAPVVFVFASRFPHYYRSLKRGSECGVEKRSQYGDGGGEKSGGASSGL